MLFMLAQSNLFLGHPTATGQVPVGLMLALALASRPKMLSLSIGTRRHIPATPYRPRHVAGCTVSTRRKPFTLSKRCPMRSVWLAGKVTALVLVCSGLAASDSLELRNGRHLQGRYMGGTATVIGFMTGPAIEYFAT